MNESLIITVYPTLIYLFFIFCRQIYEYIPQFDNIISYVSDDDSDDDNDILLAFNQIPT
jgi:hypothetical protein